MLNFGSPIKFKAVYKTTEGKEAHSFLTCINENEAEEILKNIPVLKFFKMISCEPLENCDDCKL